MEQNRSVTDKLKPVDVPAERKKFWQNNDADLAEQFLDRLVNASDPKRRQGQLVDQTGTAQGPIHGGKP